MTKRILGTTLLLALIAATIRMGYFGLWGLTKAGAPWDYVPSIIVLFTACGFFWLAIALVRNLRSTQGPTNDLETTRDNGHLADKEGHAKSTSEALYGIWLIIVLLLVFGVLLSFWGGIWYLFEITLGAMGPCGVHCDSSSLWWLGMGLFLLGAGILVSIPRQSRGILTP